MRMTHSGEFRFSPNVVRSLYKENDKVSSIKVTFLLPS